MSSLSCRCCSSCIERQKPQSQLWARYYNPANGRFNRLDPFAGISEDPISLHKYLYTHGDPVNAIDPSGEVRLASLLAGISVGVGLLGVVGFTALPLFRGPNIIFDLTAQLPSTLNKTNVLYHSVELQGSNLSVDQAFKRVTSLPDLLPFDIIIGTGSAQGVGSILNFRLVSGIDTQIGQRPFNVRVVRYKYRQNRELNSTSTSRKKRCVSGRSPAGHGSILFGTTNAWYSPPPNFFGGAYDYALTQPIPRPGMPHLTIRPPLAAAGW